MQFLSNLVPGLREARSALVGGYGWLFVAYLIIGEVPDTEGTRFESLADAIGPAGIAIVVSFVAYVIGSFVEDLFSNVVRIRGARSLLADLPNDPRVVRFDPASPSLGVMRRAELDAQRDVAEALAELPERVWAEIERLESQIDRGNAEVLLRSSLIPPLTIASIYLAIQESWWWALGLAVSAALVFQVVLRTRRLRDELNKSAVLRGLVSTAYEVRLAEQGIDLNVGPSPPASQ